VQADHPDATFFLNFTTVPTGHRGNGLALFRCLGRRRGNVMKTGVPLAGSFPNDRIAENRTAKLNGWLGSTSVSSLSGQTLPVAIP